MLWCLNKKCLEPNTKLDSEAAFINMSHTINQAHQMLGHMNKEYTKDTAKYRQWEIKQDSLEKCESCAILLEKQDKIIEEMVIKMIHL